MTADATQLPTGTGTSLESVKTSIREKAKDSTLTEQELAELRNEICQLSPEAMKQLQKFIDEEYKGILVATRMKLDALLKECTPLNSASNTTSKPSEVGKSAPEVGSELTEVFKDTKSDMMKRAPAIVSAKIMEEIKTWNIPSNAMVKKEDLMGKYAENITTAMFAKIASGDIMQLAGGFVDQVGAIKEVVNDPNMDTASKAIETLTKETEVPKDGAKQENGESSVTDNMKALMDKVKVIAQDSLKPLRTAAEKNPQDIFLPNLLSDPEYLSTYTGMENGWRIDPSHPTPESRKAFFEHLKDRVMMFDGKLLEADKMKDGIFEGMSHLPDLLTDSLYGLLKFFLDIPFIGALLAGWLGYGDAESALEWTKEEVRRRKSINMLREYGNKVSDGKDGFKTGSKRKTIWLLEDIDLSRLTSKELAGFFDTMKKSGVDITHPKFWETVFNEKTLSAKQGEKDGIFSWEFAPSDKLGDITGKLNRTVWKGNPEPAKPSESTPSSVTGVQGTTPQQQPNTSWTGVVTPVVPVVVGWGATASPESTPQQPSGAPPVASTPPQQETPAPQAKPWVETPVAPDALEKNLLAAVQKLPAGPISQFTFENNGKPENVVFDYTNQKVQIGSQFYSINVDLGYISSVEVRSDGKIHFVPRIGTAYLPKLSKEAPLQEPLPKEDFVKAMIELVKNKQYVYRGKDGGVKMTINQVV